MKLFKRIKNLFKKLFHKDVEETVSIQPFKAEQSFKPIIKQDFIGPASSKNEAALPSRSDLLKPKKKKLKGGTTPESDPLFSCIEFIGTKLLTGLGAAAWNTFYTDVINKGVTEMTQILAALEDIQKTLNELVKLYKNSTYEEYINQRYKYVAEMINAQTYYNQQLEKLNPTDEKAKKVLTDWSKANISGNSALVQFENFVDWILDVKINQNTLYNIYDLYVYNTTAWEHKGYDFREQLRELDAAAIASNAALTILYIKQNPDIDDDVRENQLNTISAKLKKYYDYADEHKVIRHNDRYICQIEHTHFEMSYGWWRKDFYNHQWFKNGRDWDTENAESTWCLLWGDDYGTVAGKNAGKQLYKAELDRIKKYYGDVTYSDIFFKILDFEYPEGCNADNVLIPLCTWVVDHPEDSTHRAQSFGQCVYKDSIVQGQVGTAQIEHTGFLWLCLTFRGWSWFNENKNFLFTNVISRDEDNYKD